ncbi:DUF309 domain-containing protein [Bhargavaea ullalensis]|uniref:Metal-dependent hydrolase n=1 Tax=Bhargavaea ullalensis TaxID=1265685 RepID=A0ABV2GDU0_9BACL
MHALRHPLFIKFMAYFNGNQDYFECHEVLEDYWNEVAPRDKTHPLVGYILVAVAFYHWRRGNFAGAEKSMENGLGKLSGALEERPEFFEGIDAGQLLASAGRSLNEIRAGQPFRSFEIRVLDPDLQAAVNTTASSLTDRRNSPSLIHKHMQRHRSAMPVRPKKGRDSRH